VRSNPCSSIIRVIALGFLVSAMCVSATLARTETIRDHCAVALAYRKQASNDSTNQAISSEEDRTNPHKQPFILSQLYHDVTYLATAPDFYGVVGGIGLAPLAFRPAFRGEDPELTEDWGPSNFADNFFEAGETFGNALFPVAVAVASWGIGNAEGSQHLSKFGSDLLQSEAINGAITVTMKFSINRRRPNGGPYSYPSGHTSAAFTAAGTVYADFGRSYGIPAFALAGYVGLSRLQEGKHYLTDVVAGGILGTYVSLKLAHRENTSYKRVSISPFVSSGIVGLSLDARF
jgi:membrane-associated phospholipid phosphatase